MLASPLYPAPPFSPGRNAEDSSQYRPARDIESFNSLLPPAIEFVEGSSSGTLAVAEGKYEPINGSPKARAVAQTNGASPVSNVKTPQKHKGSNPSPSTPSLHSGTFDISWPNGVTVGSGLQNMGNTCFLNSALQCLLHTPPLLRVIYAHSQADPCRVKSGFCMACALRAVMLEAHSGKRRAFNPYQINTRLQAVAKHMRKGRQEDSHEYLRYAIDALQKSCLAGLPQKPDPKLAETTWVHKMFGGRLRSRVTCQECQHNSDTFDSILDLSIDINNCGGLKDALKRFVAVDYLKGQNKYKCEKCKRAVVAAKRFTIHDAPLVLTVHLKRFTPMGRKIGHPLRYDERLSLQPYMSDGQYGPTYSLYGIISHAGGGPNSGHYYAHVKGSNGRWYEMNDESVTPVHSAPTNMKNAYILFYMRDKGQALEAAVSSVPSRPAAVVTKTGVAAAMKKRKIVHSDDEEDVGVKAAPSTPAPFIGPVLPNPPVLAPTKDAEQSASRPDPQAELIKKKIMAAKESPALKSLAQYTDDDDEDDDGEKPASATQDAEPKPQAEEGSTKTNPAASAPPPSPAAPPSTPAPAPPSTPVTTPIPPGSFYAPLNSAKKSETGSAKKRKSPDNEDERGSEDAKNWARQPLTFSSPGRSQSKWKSNGGGKRSSLANPYNRLSGGNNLRSPRDDTHQSRRPAKYGKRRRLIF